MAGDPVADVNSDLGTKESDTTSTISNDPSNQQTVETRIKSSHVEAAFRTAHVNIEALPNELVSNIFGFLDTPQPSASALLDEPKFELTHSEVADLKAISLVSKQWRQAILPVLFKHVRFITTKQKPTTPSTILNADIQPLLDFVSKNSLSKVITSFVLLVQDREFAYDWDGDYRRNGFASFWHALFMIIDPAELIIVAHVQALGSLTSCNVNLADAWNFDCPYHYLRLQQQPVALANEHIVANKAVPPHEYPTTNLAHQVVEPVMSTFSTENVRKDLLKHEHTIEPIHSGAKAPDLPGDGVPETEDRSSPFQSSSASPPLEFQGIRHSKASALFNIRPWSSLLLNEGSFVRAYSTYEFWLRRAPSILSDLVGAEDQPAGPLMSPTIREMSYIGIFPFTAHFSALTRNLPRLNSLYVQLVPRNDILENPSKIAQIEMEDLWMERNSCYAILMRELFNAPPLHNYKYLEVFESGDAADTDAWHMAVEYVKRAGNGWKVAGDGVFVRDLKDLEPEPEPEPEGSGAGGTQSSLSVN